MVNQIHAVAAAAPFRFPRVAELSVGERLGGSVRWALSCARQRGVSVSLLQAVALLTALALTQCR
jgi:hypothetical protein